MNSSQCLVSFDTDRVKEYVFATSKLMEVRGASALLEELNKRKTDKTVAQVLDLPDADNVRIYAAGGSAMYEAPQRKAEDLIHAVARLYREDTITASITGAWALLEGRSFKDARNEVALKLRQEKARHGRPAILPVAPYLQFCDSCGLYPAAERAKDPDGVQKHLCRSCDIKRKRGRKDRVSLFWEEFQKVARETNLREEWGRVERPEDFTQIGEKARPTGYIGLIYCDGNQMGKFFEQLDTKEDHSSRANEVDEAIRQATYKTLLDRYAPETLAPFEVLLLGGDDLLLVTTADQALEVAIGVAERFEQFAPRPLTLSTGVVIAHDSFPIAQMRELADELLKQAKRRSFEANGVSTIDFTVVTAASAGDIERTREEVLTNRGFARQLDSSSAEVEITHWLTERPYTISELKTLLKHARRLIEVGFPRSRLQTMYEALFVSERAAMTAATMGVARTGQQKHYDAIVGFFADFGVNIKAPAFPPWRKEKDPIKKNASGDPVETHKTALGDLVEIYPFVGRG